jgi:MFS family permease
MGIFRPSTLARFREVGGRNALILSLCNGLFTCAISIDLTLTGLTGWQLAPDKALATLPFALITVAGAVSTLFASHLLQRIGRRRAFAVGSLMGALGGAFSVWAVMHASFWVFCIGTALVGVYQAFAQYYRLAAADAVDTAHKARAISVVLMGGVIAAIAGPLLAAWSKDLFATGLFAGAYLMVVLLGLASATLLLAFFRDKAPLSGGGRALPATLPPRPIGVVLRQPIFIASAANTIVGAVVMMFVMTAAPLAAVAAHHTVNDGASIIQWHLVGMYAPSFLTGWLISRFGLSPILFAGMALNLACAAVAVSSASLAAFHGALFLLGVGWNFMFVGGTTLLARSYRPSEQARTQGMAEFIRFAATALASLAAGPALAAYGWSSLNIAVVPVLALAAAMTLWWVMSERVPKRAVAP